MIVRLAHHATSPTVRCLLPVLALVALTCCTLSAQGHLGAGSKSNLPPGPPKSPGPVPRPVGPEPGSGKVVDIETYAQTRCDGRKLCQKAFAAALSDTRAYFKQNPDANYTLVIPPGTYDLSDETTTLPGQRAVIDVSNIWPATGTFTLRGAGSSQTTLITANETTPFFGRHISNITIEGLALRRKTMTTTQGTVVTAKQGLVSMPGQVTLLISPGFPLVTEIYNPQSGNGNWLRSYDNINPLDPHIDTDPSNVQIHFGHRRAPTCAGRLCTLYLDPPSAVIPAVYTRPHEVVGVKSAKGGGAYTFDDRESPGSNVGFRDIVWYDEGRGIFLSIKKVFVLNCSIRRRSPVQGQTQAMSSPAGGPQIAYNKDHPMMDAGNRVDHFTAESTGDDSLALFNDMSPDTVFSNTIISNSFARTINLFRSCHVRLENNVGRFCSPAFDFPKQYKACITDTSHPGPTPCGPDL